jgi:hypothetical protein
MRAAQEPSEEYSAITIQQGIPYWQRGGANNWDFPSVVHQPDPAL